MHLGTMEPMVVGRANLSNQGNSSCKGTVLVSLLLTVKLSWRKKIYKINFIFGSFEFFIGQGAFNCRTITVVSIMCFQPHLISCFSKRTWLLNTGQSRNANLSSVTSMSFLSRVPNRLYFYSFAPGRTVIIESQEDRYLACIWSSIKWDFVYFISVLESSRF